MLVRSMIERFGNARAVHNARLASSELSRRRVERESVEIFLMHLEGGHTPGRMTRASAAASDGTKVAALGG